ncbi:MAG TPA: hypothetical protein VHE53_00710 [Patescibacteria group bacterium]|nr:hypothetical protein [Patescibacteria group bacterium]
MSKNPILNGIAALAYISIIASTMFYAPHIDNKPSVFMPIIVLSLFTFSAAIMAYIFFFNPFQMYFNGKKKAAIELAFKSLATFGILTIILLVLLLSRVLG